MVDQALPVVVITGGNSGIGKAVARSFAHDSLVAIIGRNPETLRLTEQELGPRVRAYQADVARSDDVSAVVQAIVEQRGRIDVLINAAGIFKNITTATPIQAAEQTWDDVLAVNLKGSFLMAMAVTPYLPRPGGRIITISSIAAYNGGSRPGTLAYAAAKAGTHGLTYSLARELGPEGITVNVIAAGFVEQTGITGQWPRERIESIIAQTPVGRAGRADDIAGAARYLASPAAAFVNGEVLNVNGGWLFGR